MAVITRMICDHCRKSVPEECDGATYTCRHPVGMWDMELCIGADGHNIFDGAEGKIYRLVRGHGDYFDLPLTKCKS